MIRAYHAIWGAYGFWLPNDPRGSWSDFVASWELVQVGKPVGKTLRDVDRKDWQVWREEAMGRLRYPAVALNGKQARAIGTGFGEAARRSGYNILACSILPQHVHLVFGRHTYDAEQVCIQLKGEATKQLKRDHLHPLAEFAKDGRLPSVWEEGQWIVFLDDDANIRTAIDYVEQNPVKEGKPKQRWSFVTPWH
jgi:REP element-mobilizing transposase RayT